MLRAAHLGATPTLNRFVDAADDRSSVSDNGAQQEPQEVAEHSTGPGGAVQDPVIGLEVGLSAPVDKRRDYSWHP